MSKALNCKGYLQQERVCSKLPRSSFETVYRPTLRGLRSCGIDKCGNAGLANFKIFWTGFQAFKGFQRFKSFPGWPNWPTLKLLVVLTKAFKGFRV